MRGNANPWTGWFWRSWIAGLVSGGRVARRMNEESSPGDKLDTAGTC